MYDNNIEKWIRQNRLLRYKNSDIGYSKKEQEYLGLFNIALNGRKIPAKPYIYESHNANISQIPHLNSILCDIHFRDIAKLIAASFYVAPEHDIKRLADLLMADSLLIHGNPYLALEYAHKFVNGPYVAVLGIMGEPTILDLIELERCGVLYEDI